MRKLVFNLFFSFIILIYSFINKPKISLQLTRNFKMFQLSPKISKISYFVTNLTNQIASNTTSGIIKDECISNTLTTLVQTKVNNLAISQIPYYDTSRLQVLIRVQQDKLVYGLQVIHLIKFRSFSLALFHWLNENFGQLPIVKWIGHVILIQPVRGLN